MHDEHRMEIFACRNSESLAEKIVEKLGAKLGQSNLLTFSDGEFQPAYEESVRGASVYIVQSTNPPVENLFELLLMIDAAKRASAHKVIAVIPYFGWARQDRKDRPRVPIAAKLVANLLTAAGCDRVMSCDLHADQIQGFFDVPVDHIYAQTVFLPYIKKLKLKNLSVAAPDMGGAKRANSYAKKIGCPMIICHKTRAKANVVESITAIGEVEGRDIVIVDDMIDTAGTLCTAADVLMKMGAASVRACATHGVLSGAAIDNINRSSLKEVIITDTIPHDFTGLTDKITVLSIAPLFAEVINSVYNNISIGPIFQRL
ncbi:MAG: ribose-phosphate pyrophosphokinase [Bacteroidales bacterium]|nr:ribose-phosphate pyrophosphokinase [Candidatus Hennigimonas equi]